LKGWQFLPAFLYCSLWGNKKNFTFARGSVIGCFFWLFKDPMEKDIRIVIEEAVKLIVAKTPKQYYLVSTDPQPSDESTTASQPQASPVPPRTILPSQCSTLSSGAEAQAQALPVGLHLEKFAEKENDLLRGELI
jgi:hypothetical protein